MLSTDDLLELWSEAPIDTHGGEAPYKDLHEIAKMVLARVSAEDALMACRASHDDPEAQGPVHHVVDDETITADWALEVRSLAIYIWEHHTPEGKAINKRTRELMAASFTNSPESSEVYWEHCRTAEIAWRRMWETAKWCARGLDPDEAHAAAVLEVTR